MPGIDTIAAADADVEAAAEDVGFALPWSDELLHPDAKYAARRKDHRGRTIAARA